MGVVKEFFMPAIQDVNEANKKYEEIKSINEKDNYPISDKRIYSISFEHNSIERTNTVGVECEENREIVIAIFKTENNLFYTITRLRGLYTPNPLITSNVKDIVYFRDSNSEDNIL